jgi:hypothetical protein
MPAAGASKDQAQAAFLGGGLRGCRYRLCHKPPLPRCAREIKLFRYCGSLPFFILRNRVTVDIATR